MYYYNIAMSSNAQVDIRHFVRCHGYSASRKFDDVTVHSSRCYESHMSFWVMGKGFPGARLKLAWAKMAKVPTVVKMTKITRNMRSTTMATYCQSFFSWKGMEWQMKQQGGEENGKLQKKIIYRNQLTAS